MSDKLTVRTLVRIDDPQRGGASIQSGATVTLSRKLAEKLIAEGKAEAVRKDEKK